MSSFAKRILLLAIPFLALTPFSAAQELPSRNVRFGAPAKTNAAQREDHLIERSQYSLSYNARTRTPNWVSWCLRKEDIGKSMRGAFEPDPLLPKGFAKVSTQAYTGSGFDRGHMCPAQDRSSKQKDMDATFYTTNIVPQAPNCNQRAWERLESYCRTLAKDHALYICCGPHGVGGEGKNGFAKKIGKVTVPAKVWKVMLVLPSEDAEPRRNTRTIAVIMPNDQTVDFDWAKYRVSVRDVERLTGYTFFPNIEPEVAREIKKDADTVKVKTPKSKAG